METAKTYCDAIDAYKNDNFEVFKEITDKMNTNHEFMFLLFLEIQVDLEKNPACSDYLIDTFSNQLTKEELILCTISNLACLDKIYEKNNLPYFHKSIKNKISNDTFKGSITRTNLITILRIFDRSVFEILYREIMKNTFIFGGEVGDFQLIQNWLLLIRHIITFNPFFKLIDIT